MVYILSFKSDGRAILYSGKLKDTFDNWALAGNYAKQNNMRPIETTEGGLYISVPDRYKIESYKSDDALKLWDRASVKYCLSIEGSVKTFVCGATNRSTFRRKEIHAMMRAKHINDINGRDHEYYVLVRRATLNRLRDENKCLPDDQKLSGKERHQMAINAVFTAMAMNEVLDDLTHAQNDAERIDILLRVDHLKNQHEKEMAAKRAAKSSFNTAANDNADKAATDEALNEMLMANPHLHPILAPLMSHAHH